MEIEETFQALTTFKDQEKSIALVLLRGVNRPARYGLHAKYKILIGCGYVAINGQVREVNEGDSFTVNRGDIAQDCGYFLAEVVCNPPFTEDLIDYNVEQQLPLPMGYHVV